MGPMKREIFVEGKEYCECWWENALLERRNRTSAEERKVCWREWIIRVLKKRRLGRCSSVYMFQYKHEVRRFEFPVQSRDLRKAIRSLTPHTEHPKTSNPLWWSLTGESLRQKEDFRYFVNQWSSCGCHSGCLSTWNEVLYWIIWLIKHF